MPHKTHACGTSFRGRCQISTGSGFDLGNEASKIWSKQHEGNTRNAATHGENVLADIQVIQDMEQDDPSTYFGSSGPRG